MKYTPMSYNQEFELIIVKLREDQFVLIHAVLHVCVNDMSFVLQINKLSLLSLFTLS